MKNSTDTYPCTSVTVLEGLSPIRKRPSIFVGSTDKAGYHQLLWGLIDNASYEFVSGIATTVKVVLHKGLRSITVEDDGRGLPTEVSLRYGKPVFEILMTTLFIGKSTSINSNNTLPIVNALSSELKVSTCNGVRQFDLTFVRGVAQSNPKIIGRRHVKGTKIQFKPDSDIFGKELYFDVELITTYLKECANKFVGLNYVLIDEGNNTRRDLCYSHLTEK